MNEFVYVELDGVSTINTILASDTPKIKFRSGYYYIDEPLVVDNYHIIEGVARDCGHGTEIVASSNFPMGAPMVIINNTGVEISHVTFNGAGRAGTGIFSGPEMLGNSQLETTRYGLRFQDVQVFNCRNCGIDLCVFMCTLDRVNVKDCGQGFFIHGIEDMSDGYYYVGGTTLLLSQCYVKNCPIAGFEIANMNYSAMICCAADDCGMTGPDCDLQGKSLSNGYGYSYRFYGCHTMHVTSCGAEASNYTLFFTLCSNFCINNFSEYNPTNRNWITSAPIVMVQCGYMTFQNCIFEGKKDITLDDSSTKRVILIANGSQPSRRISFNYCSVEQRMLSEGMLHTESGDLTSDHIFGDASGNSVINYG